MADTDETEDDVEEALKEAPTPAGITEEVSERAEDIGEVPPEE